MSASSATGSCRLRHIRRYKFFRIVLNFFIPGGFFFRISPFYSALRNNFYDHVRIKTDCLHPSNALSPLFLWIMYGEFELEIRIALKIGSTHLSVDLDVPISTYMHILIPGVAQV